MQATDREWVWRAHPARERPGAAAAVTAVVVALVAVATISFGSPAISVPALALLVLALNRFYFPSRFRIDDEGITARYTLRRQRCRWSEVRRFRHDERGAWLTPRSRPSRLDAYRGMHILFGRHREEVIERIRRCLTRERASEAD